MICAISAICFYLLNDFFIHLVLIPIFGCLVKGGQVIQPNYSIFSEFFLRLWMGAARFNFMVGEDNWGALYFSRR